MKTNAKRKTYVIPGVRVYSMEISSVLAASYIDPDSDDNVIEGMDEEDWSGDYSWD